MSYLYTSPTTPATGSTNLMGNLTINAPIYGHSSSSVYGYSSSSASTSATNLVWNGTSPTWTTTATTAAHINQAGRMELKGESADVVLSKVSEGSGNFGYNAATEQYCDMVTSGVVDPTKVANH